MALNNNCLRCGQETEGGNIFCPRCMDASGAGKRKSFWIFSIFFSVVLLVLSGLLMWQAGRGMWDFSWSALLGRPAATVNGDVLTRKDFNARLRIVRSMFEKQYGKEMFAGERGRDILRSMKGMVLNKMVEERLIAREAESLGIKIDSDAVDREIQDIAQEIYGSREKFDERIREDGIAPEALRSHIRNVMVVKALIKAKAANLPAGITPEGNFNNWIVQAKNNAKVKIYDVQPAIAAPPAGSCCGSAGTTVRCGTGAPGPADAETEKKASAAALAAYKEAGGDARDLKVKVSDYGCHIQVDLDKNGKIVKSYSYRDGKVFEI